MRKHLRTVLRSKLQPVPGTNLIRAQPENAPPKEKAMFIDKSLIHQEIVVVPELGPKKNDRPLAKFGSIPILFDYREAAPVIGVPIKVCIVDTRYTVDPSQSSLANNDILYLIVKRVDKNFRLLPHNGFEQRSVAGSVTAQAMIDGQEITIAKGRHAAYFTDNTHLNLADGEAIPAGAVRHPLVPGKVYVHKGMLRSKRSSAAFKPNLSVIRADSLPTLADLALIQVQILGMPSP